MINERRPMKLAIVGSRHLTLSTSLLNEYAQTIFEMWDVLDVSVIRQHLEIVSGGARGIDTCAKDLARAEGYQYTEFPADWNKHGKAAGPIRNKQIVSYSDVVLAFWDAESRGTLSTIRYAKKAGKPCMVIIK